MGRGISLPVAYGRLVAEEGQCSGQEVNNKQQEWIWQYVLKNCNDFSIATHLLESIPIPNTPFIKKLTLLKLLSMDMESGCYADRDLYALQGLEEIFREETRKRGGGEREEAKGDEEDASKRRLEMESIWPKLRTLVKAELALQHLRDGKEDWDAFESAYDAHWGDVVQDTEEQECCEARSIKSDLLSLKTSLKVNHKVIKFLVGENKREAVDGLMKRFLALAWEDIGPVFLEKVDEDISSGRYRPCEHHEEEFSKDDEDEGVKKKRGRKTLVVNSDEEDSNLARPPWGGEPERPVTRRLRQRRYESNAVQTPDLERAVNELNSSRLHLRQKVCDPLPEAIDVARSLREAASTANGVTEHRAEEQEQPDEQVKAQASEPPQASGSEKQQEAAGAEANGNQTSQEQQAQAAAVKGKKSIMERNHTARTCEWDDDNDDIEVSTSPSASKHLNLPSTSTKATLSPLRKAQPSASYLQRRKFKRWTTREEEALRKGVDRYGKGRWKAILQANLDVFENRTEVDLKDKWRNIEKAEGIKRE